MGNPNDETITKWQYRYSTATDTQGNPVWEPNWSDIASTDLLGTNNLRYEKAGFTGDTPVAALTNGTLYTFQIRAVNDGGAGPEGTTAMTPASLETAPSGIINLQWTEENLWAIFTWNQGDDSVNGYQYRSSKSSSIFSESDSWTNATIATDEGVTSFRHFPGDTPIRFYQFRPVNTDADPNAPGPITAITVTITNTPGTSPEPPAAPQNLLASAALSGSQWDITLTWDNPGDDTIDNYQVRQSQDGGGYSDFADISSSGATTTTHTISKVTAGTSYTFQLRAVNTDLDSGEGAVATSKAVNPGAPGAPTVLAVATTGDNAPTQTTLHLSWTAPAEITNVTVDGYQYRKRASADTEWGDWTATGSSDVTYYTVPGLSAGTTYDFQVRAMAGTIGGPASNSGSGTTANPANVPAGLPAYALAVWPTA